MTPLYPQTNERKCIDRTRRTDILPAPLFREYSQGTIIFFGELPPDTQRRAVSHRQGRIGTAAGQSQNPAGVPAQRQPSLFPFRRENPLQGK